jgi:hypothetical protein
MSFFADVSNWLLGSYRVRTTKLTSDDSHIQHVRIDVGSGDSESLLTGANPLPVSQGKAGSAAITNVNDSNSSTTILASNVNRIAATVYNDSSALLYLLYGSGTASSTNYTLRIYPNGYHEVHGNFTGQLTGIWATDPNDGAARVTELTA